MALCLSGRERWLRVSETGQVQFQKSYTINCQASQINAGKKWDDNGQPPSPDPPPLHSSTPPPPALQAELQAPHTVRHAISTYGTIGYPGPIDNITNSTW